MNFKCGHCSNLMSVGNELIGKQVKCPYCRQVVVAPGSTVNVPVPPPVGPYPPMPPIPEPVFKVPAPRGDDDSIFTTSEDLSEDLFGQPNKQPKVEIPGEPKNPTVVLPNEPGRRIWSTSPPYPGAGAETPPSSWLRILKMPWHVLCATVAKIMAVPLFYFLLAYSVLITLIAVVLFLRLWSVF